MNRLDQVPAIVRQNVRSIQSLMDCCANGYRATVAQAETWLANHAELRVRYKERFSTWEAACEHVYGVTRQAVHKKLLKISDGVLDVSATLVAKEETAITRVEQARKEPDLSCVPAEVRDAVVEHIHDAHKPVTVKEADNEAQSSVPHGNEPDFELHQPAERAQMPKPALGIIGWSVKLMELFDKLPKDELAPKLDWQHRKIVENSIDLLRSTLSVFIPKTSVVEPCKCGCGLTVGVCEALFRIGVPSVGLTQNQAGLLISKAKANNYKLPEAFLFARNEGEWVERKFKGTKPAKKEA